MIPYVFTAFIPFFKTSSKEKLSFMLRTSSSLLGSVGVFNSLEALLHFSVLPPTAGQQPWQCQCMRSRFATSQGRERPLRKTAINSLVHTWAQGDDGAGGEQAAGTRSIGDTVACTPRPPPPALAPGPGRGRGAGGRQPSRWPEQGPKTQEAKQ